MLEHKPLVSICCLTYNHENYIRECLDGFLKQNTTFTYEILIHDDASTDGTADIIHEYWEKYPNIIKPIFQTENQYSQGKNCSNNNYNRVSGKYVALCEGDDYWIDPNKLQKQVDFLEANPDFSACFHKVKTYIQQTNEWGEHNPPRILARNTKGFCFGLFYYTVFGWFTRTSSCVCRADVMRYVTDYPIKCKRDFITFYLMLKHGKAYYDCTPMSVYRIHSGGICSGTDVFARLKIDCGLWHELWEHEHTIWSWLNWKKCLHQLHKLEQTSRRQ